MNDFVVSTVIALCFILMLRLVQGSFEAWERPWLFGALFLRFFSAIAHVLVVKEVYGYGDMLSYHWIGTLTADLIRQSPGDTTWQLAKVIFLNEEVALPVPFTAGATGSMQAISGFFVLFSNDSLYGACILAGGLTFFAGVGVYRVFRYEYGRDLHRMALLAALCVPSVVFWSSALLKESVAVAGLGAAVYGGHAAATGRRVWKGLLLLVAGLAVAAVVKPYVLLPFAFAVGLWLYLDGPKPEHRRRYHRFRVGSLIAGTVIAVGLVVAIGQAFPRFSPEDYAERAATMQGAVEVTTGGSDYSIGSAKETSFAGQVAFVPLAVVTALFRPAFFEARNAQMAVNAMETAFITGLFLVALFRAGPLGGLRAIWFSPALAFCAVYSIGLAAIVGLGSTNLGSLSRYRMPLVPFFVLLLGVLSRRRQQTVAVAHAASSRVLS